MTTLSTLARTGLDGDAPTLWDAIDLDDVDDRTFGDYELLERMGRGGMGMVFRARQISLDREVAVKFIVGTLATRQDAVDKFLDEARAAARLHHPHIVPVYEVGVIEGMHFFSMPLLSPRTLAQRIGDDAFDTQRIVDHAIALTSAVAYANGFGLLHMDLKPANVLFDAHDRPMIADFGLARRMSGGHVDVRGTSGTPAYMAPEQRGEGMHRLTPQTDVYSLGAILREMLGAHRIDRDLDAICRQCTANDPNQRYASATELMRDLERYRRGDDVRARRVPPFERAWRAMRRHPSLTLSALAAFAVLLIGLAATTWQWQRAERQT
jgi:serine/threonine protein kinase